MSFKYGTSKLITRDFLKVYPKALKDDHLFLTTTKTNFDFRRSFILFLFIILLIGSINLVSSAPPVKAIALSNSNGLSLSPSLWDSVAINKNLTFYVHVFNSSNGLLYSGSGTLCGLYIYNEFNDLSTGVYENDSGAISSGTDFKFSIPQGTFTSKGAYSYKVWCNHSTDQVGGFYEKPFYVTQSGQAPADDTLTLFIYLLFIISTIGLFTTFILTLAKLVTFRETIFGILTTWGFVVLNMIVNYLGKEFLLRTFVDDITGTFITITIWSNGVLPVISLIVTMFVVSTQKKKPIGVEELTGGRRLFGYG